MRAKPFFKVGYVYLKNSQPEDPSKSQIIAFWLVNFLIAKEALRFDGSVGDPNGLTI